jgi:hypothetical protein
VGRRTITIKRNTQTLIDASKEVDLEVNPEKTNYTVTCMSMTIDGVWIGDWIY